MQQTSHKKHRLRFLSLGLTCLLSAAALAWSAMIAGKGTITGWELDIFRSVNSSFDDVTAIAVAAKAISLTLWVPVALVVGLYIAKKYSYAWRLAAGFIVVNGLGFILEHVVDRARPAAILQDVVVRSHGDGYGYASTHTLTVTVIALLLVPMLPKIWRWLPFLWIACMATARVYLGLHAPLDVIGGVALGLTLVSFYYLLPDVFLRFFKLNRRPVKRSSKQAVQHSELATKPLVLESQEQAVVQKPGAPALSTQKAPKRAAAARKRAQTITKRPPSMPQPGKNSPDKTEPKPAKKSVTSDKKRKLVQ